MVMANQYASTTDILILPSCFKTLMLLLADVLFVRFSVQNLQTHGVGILPILSLVLFGLTLPLFVKYFSFPLPLIRATEAGIEYNPKGFPFTQHDIPWHKVRLLSLRNMSFLPFGGQRIVLHITRFPYVIEFRDWQIPRSAKRTLALMLDRFRDPIYKYNIAIAGIDT